MPHTADIELELFPIRRVREEEKVFWVYIRQGAQARREREAWPANSPTGEIVDYLLWKYSEMPGRVQCIALGPKPQWADYIWLSGEAA